MTENNQYLQQRIATTLATNTVIQKPKLRLEALHKAWKIERGYTNNPHGYPISGDMLNRAGLKDRRLF